MKNFITILQRISASCLSGPWGNLMASLSLPVHSKDLSAPLPMAQDPISVPFKCLSQPQWPCSRAGLQPSIVLSSNELHWSRPTGTGWQPGLTLVCPCPQGGAGLGLPQCPKLSCSEWVYERCPIHLNFHVCLKSYFMGYASLFSLQINYFEIFPL